MEEKRPMGRPPKYNDEMPQKLIDYFSQPLRVKKTIQQATASGKMVEVEVEEFADPLFIESFCADHQISKQTFYRWVEEKPEFSDAFHQIKPLQARMLLVGAMQGGYNASISKLILANCTDYKEKKEIDYSGEIKMTIDRDDEKL